MHKKSLSIVALVSSAQFNAFSQLGIGRTYGVIGLHVKGAPTNTTNAGGRTPITLTGNGLKAKDAVDESSQTRTINTANKSLTKNSLHEDVSQQAFDVRESVLNEKHLFYRGN